MDYDLCVIGGGINGAGIARDAAGRGLSVLLVEAQDLAQATSSSSTKLIHGGLRYLEQYEFSLVKKSLRERSVLLKMAPHIIWPMDFVLPHDDSLRPYWMIQMGLRLYDFLGGRKKLKSSIALDFATQKEGDPLNNKYKRGFSYADCWVEDSRLVVLNAMDAYERGADIMPRTACVKMEPSVDQNGWDITLANTMTNDQFQIKAAQVVNAAGPWVRSLLDNSELSSDEPAIKTPQIKLVQGSHIIVPKIYDGEHSYILQQPDGRIVFAIPYEHDFTLTGTTEKEITNDDLNHMSITEEETQYLCTAINSSFEKQIALDDIVFTYSGTRPLLDDGAKNASKVTRDYKLFLDTTHGAPMLSVFGGKITTYRKLSEEVVDILSTFYDKKKMKAWTEYAPLPGGNIPNADFEKFLDQKLLQYPFLDDALITRYARAYGARMDVMLEHVESLSDMGEHYGDNLFEIEILYLIQNEFAMTLDDILWRRSKLGLHISPQTRELLNVKIADVFEKSGEV